jgi:hypothetical protein
VRLTSGNARDDLEEANDLPSELIEYLFHGTYEPTSSKWGIELSHSESERKAAWFLHRDALLDEWLRRNSLAADGPSTTRWC